MMPFSMSYSDPILDFKFSIFLNVKKFENGTRTVQDRVILTMAD